MLVCSVVISYYTECPEIYRKTVLQLHKSILKQMQYTFTLKFGTLSSYTFSTPLPISVLCNDEGNI